MHIALILDIDTDNADAAMAEAQDFAEGCEHENITVLGPVPNDGTSYVGTDDVTDLQSIMRAMRHLARQAVEAGLADHNDVVGDVAQWQVGE
jgi:hypothetical protein